MSVSRSKYKPGSSAFKRGLHKRLFGLGGDMNFTEGHYSLLCNISPPLIIEKYLFVRAYFLCLIREMHGDTWHLSFEVLSLAEHGVRIPFKNTRSITALTAHRPEYTGIDGSTRQSGWHKLKQSSTQHTLSTWPLHFASYPLFRLAD